MRVYSIAFENVTIAAVQDVFALKAGTAKGLQVRHIWLGAGGVTSPAEIRLRLKRLPATVTIGSGGTAPTIGKVDSTNGTASNTANARANDTTQATTGGTAVTTLPTFQWNVLNPFDYMPGPEADDQEKCDVSEGLVFEVVATPASTVVSGFIKWGETP